MKMRLIYLTWSDLAYLSLAAVEACLLLIVLSWFLRKVCRVEPAAFDMPERMMAIAAWPFSRSARRWLRQHPESQYSGRRVRP